MVKLDQVVTQDLVTVYVGKGSEKPSPVPLVTLGMGFNRTAGMNHQVMVVEMTPGQTRHLINALLAALGRDAAFTGPDVIVDGGGEASSPPEGA
jgi:hypothetical protein